MNENDKKVRELYGIVAKKREEIGKIQKPDWKTNCNFNYDPKASGVHTQSNIQTVRDTGELVRMLGFLLAQKTGFDAAAKVLGIKGEFKWGGYTLEDWQADFQTQVNRTQVSVKVKELENLEKRLDAILSPELKAQLELEAITKALEE